MIHQMTKKNGCVFYETELSGQVRNEELKAALDKIKEIEVPHFKGHDWFVLSLKSVKAMPPNFTSHLCRMASHFEQHGLKFAIIAEAKICNLIVKNGIERLVNFATSADEFYKLHGIDNSKDNVRIFLNSMLDSTISSMKVLLELQNIEHNVEVITDTKDIPHIEVGAMAGVVSAHFTGNLVIGFSMDVFKKAMSRFLIMDVSEITSEIKDGAAEFLNVILGQTKMKLNELGFDIRQVIPSVIMGQKVEISPMRKQSFVRITCKTELGDVFILISTNAASSEAERKQHSAA